MNITAEGLTTGKLESIMLNECMKRGYIVDGRVGPSGSFVAIKNDGRVLVFIADAKTNGFVGRQAILVAFFISKQSGSGAAVVVTNGTFDDDARECAEKFGVRLIDVDDLQKDDALGENFSVDGVDDWSQHDEWQQYESW